MLANLQKEFWAALIGSDDDVLKSICDEGNLQPLERLEIYRSNVRLLHVSVLMSVYPVCRKILDDDYFKQIAKMYVKQNPSESVDLNDYGDRFPSFLQSLIENRPELNNFQYLADLAQLEWQIQEVYFSEDNIKLDIVEFQNSCISQAGDMSFSLQAGVSILSSEYPIAELWEIHQSDAAEHKIMNANENEYLCIFRDGYQVLLRKINADLFFLITAIQEGKTLGEIAEQFIEDSRLNAALEVLIKNEWLKHV